MNISNFGQLITTKPVTIGPDLKETVHGLVHGNLIGNRFEAMTDFIPGKFLPGDVIVVPTLVRIKGKKKERSSVCIYNPSKKSVTIPAHTVICQFSQVHSLKRSEELRPLKNQSASCQYTSQISSLHLMTERLGHMSYSQSQLLDSIDLSHLKDLPEETAQLGNLFLKYENVFSLSDLDLGKTDLIKHRIELTDSVPFKQRHRRIPPSMFNEVKAHLQQMLQAGVIRHSQSPWASNMVLVRKKDNSLRLCVDYRQLNKRTIRNSYALLVLTRL